MGIQDRDYWKREYKKPTADSRGQPQGKVYANWGEEKKRPKTGWNLSRWTWCIPLMWGFILGRNWENLEFIAGKLLQKLLD